MCLISLVFLCQHHPPSSSTFYWLYQTTMYNKITYVFEKKIHGLFLFRLVIPAHIGLIYTLFLLYKILLFTVDNTNVFGGHIFIILRLRTSFYWPPLMINPFQEQVPVVTCISTRGVKCTWTSAHISTAYLV
jgi:hypothetical protein